MSERLIRQPYDTRVPSGILCQVQNISAALDDREAVAEHHLETLESLEATEELLRVSALTELFDALRSFEGPLDKFRHDSRLRDVLAGIGTSDLEALGTRTVKNLEELRGAL